MPRNPHETHQIVTPLESLEQLFELANDYDAQENLIAANKIYHEIIQQVQEKFPEVFNIVTLKPSQELAENLAAVLFILADSYYNLACNLEELFQKDSDPQSWLEPFKKAALYYQAGKENRPHFSPVHRDTEENFANALKNTFDAIEYRMKKHYLSCTFSSQELLYRALAYINDRLDNKTAIANPTVLSREDLQNISQGILFSTAYVEDPYTKKKVNKLLSNTINVKSGNEPVFLKLFKKDQNNDFEFLYDLKKKPNEHLSSLPEITQGVYKAIYDKLIIQQKEERSYVHHFSRHLLFDTETYRARKKQLQKNLETYTTGVAVSPLQSSLSNNRKIQTRLVSYGLIPTKKRPVVQNAGAEPTSKKLRHS